MNIKINDLEQFFQACNIQKYLLFITREGNPSLRKKIDSLTGNLKKNVNRALRKESPLKTFCRENKLNIIDLDLLQIAFLEQTRTITLENYIENSVFEQNNKESMHRTINRLKNSTLVKDNYLELTDPFSSKTMNKISQKSIIDLLESSSAKKKSKKKIEFEFDSKPYKNFNDLLKDLYLLDKIFTLNIQNQGGFNIKNHDLFYKRYTKQIKKRYEQTLQCGKNYFATFLKNKCIKFKELFFIAKYYTEMRDLNQSVLQISDELCLEFCDENSLSKLLNKNILKQNGCTLVLNQKAIDAILGFKRKNLADESLLSVDYPDESFADICLPQNTFEKIMNIINQYKNHDLIFNKWGLKYSIGYGKGVSINLSGPPGTGKTLTAKAIANYLQKPIFTINYSEVENKFVGETEKNIAKVFEMVKKEEGVLFFDEADSLTTKRENAHVSWEVTRTNTLLKEMENYDGICIFATNFAGNYDDAFNRRLTAHIELNLPDKNQLSNILEIHFPKKSALHESVNFSVIAAKYEGVFSGGDVKNLVLNAARIASGDVSNKNKVIMQKHLEEASDLMENGKRNINDSAKEKLCYLG